MIKDGQPFVVLSERQLANPRLVREFESAGIEIIARKDMPMTTDSEEGWRQIEAMQPERAGTGQPAQAERVRMTTALLLRMSSTEKQMFTRAAAEAGISRNAFMLACIEKGLEVITDEQEGRRQIEAMHPEPIKVGDKVRLTAGGDRIMTVVELQDYDNMVVCECAMPYAPAPNEDSDVVSAKSEAEAVKYRDTFPVRSLVRIGA